LLREKPIESFRSMERKIFLLLMLVWGFSPVLLAQNKQISGIVTDETGSPLPGVSVQVKATTHGIATDMDGKYAIEAAQGSVLVFSSVGYATQERTVGAAKVQKLNITLKEDTQQLTEVVVVGYGTQKKENLTGAVAAVDTKKLASRPSSNIAKSLQGAVAGVTIISRPGGTSLNIRGRGNLGASDPLCRWYRGK
jgi:tonB-dependent receptor plug